MFARKKKLTYTTFRKPAIEIDDEDGRRTTDVQYSTIGSSFPSIKVDAVPSVSVKKRSRGIVFTSESERPVVVLKTSIINKRIQKKITDVTETVEATFMKRPEGIKALHEKRLQEYISSHTLENNGDVLGVSRYINFLLLH
jgi:hypothetical protein